MPETGTQCLSDLDPVMGISREGLLVANHLSLKMSLPFTKFERDIFTGSLLKTCFDLDGVFCVDPTWEENDDGEKYRKFILYRK